jgi:hypothetical protein
LAGWLMTWLVALIVRGSYNKGFLVCVFTERVHLAWHIRF